MSSRVHFWLRILSLATILAAQFGPRIWAPAGSGQAVKVAVTDNR